MKNKKFFNLDQVIRYLNDSVIRYNGEPIYISGVDTGRHSKNFTLYYYNVGDENRVQKYILSDNSGIDMNPVPIGMLSLKNTGKDSYSTSVLQRIPIRAYKIGLCRTNLKQSPVNLNYKMRWGGAIANLLLSKELRDTIVGDYHTYDEAYKQSKDKGNIVAFSRRFALAGDDLYYGNIQSPVGKIVSRKPKLDDKAFFLKEVLEEDLKNANY